MASWFKHLSLCLLAALVLGACSPSEVDQRKAFIAFLQTDVLSKQGARVPRPDAEKQKTFGDYARHYAVITSFHDRMDASVAKPMQQAMANAMPRSIEEVVQRKADIVAVRSGFTGMLEALNQSVATADSERAALKQPDDLASVYAAAYDKLVTQPATTFRDIFPPTDEAFGSVLTLAELIERNRTEIKLRGSQVEVANAALRAKVQDAMAAMSSKQRAMTDAQQKLRRVLYGN